MRFSESVDLAPSMSFLASHCLLFSDHHTLRHRLPNKESSAAGLSKRVRKLLKAFIETLRCKSSKSTTRGLLQNHKLQKAEHRSKSLTESVSCTQNRNQRSRNKGTLVTHQHKLLSSKLRLTKPRENVGTLLMLLSVGLTKRCTR